MSVFDRYVGLPYVDRGRTIDGLDCWGLHWLVHKELCGAELPSFHDRYTLPADRKLIAGLIAGELDAFVEIAAGAEQTFDAVLMRDAGEPRHVGVVVGRGRVLHVERGATSVIENYRTGRLAARVLGFYRYRAHEIGHE